MVCGIHLFANAFPKPFGDQLHPKTQHANVSAPKRGSVPRNVPACLKMVLPAPKLEGPVATQRKDMDLLLAL